MLCIFFPFDTLITDFPKKPSAAVPLLPAPSPFEGVLLLNKLLLYSNKKQVNSSKLGGEMC